MQGENNVLSCLDGGLSGRLPRMDLEKTCPPAFGGLLEYTPSCTRNMNRGYIIRGENSMSYTE